MALFFDQAWFDAKLKSLGFDRSIIASALGLAPDQVDEVWKDQRELSAREVATLSTLLQVEAAEIATRAGVSTPDPTDASSDRPEFAGFARDLAEIKERLARLESAIGDIAERVRNQES